MAYVVGDSVRVVSAGSGVPDYVVGRLGSVMKIDLSHENPYWVEIVSRNQQGFSFDWLWCSENMLELFRASIHRKEVIENEG